MYGGVVQIIIDRTSDKIIAGTWEFSRDENGTLVGPSGDTFPAAPVANEWFLRTDTNELYRRDDTNTSWILISSSGSTIFSAGLHVSSTEYVVVGNKLTDRKITLNYAYALPLSGHSMVGILVLHHDGVTVEISNEYSVMNNEFDDVEITGEILLDDIRLKIVTPALIEDPVLKYTHVIIPV